MTQTPANAEGPPEAHAAPKPRPKPPKKPKLLLKQANMQRVLYALAPLLVAGIYFFGWRVLALLAVTQAVGFLTEYLMERRLDKPVSMANFVTCTILTLSLPPTCPFYVAAVGAVVAVLFGKEVFGGFGRNFANPAITGRAFLYMCFPRDLTGQFVPAFTRFPGGFAQWAFSGVQQLPERFAHATDAVSQATPMFVAQQYGLDAVQNVQDGNALGANLVDMSLGTISGTFHVAGQAAPRVLSAGSIGEVSAVLIVLAGIYLLVTKTANWRLMIPAILGVAVANVLFRDVLGYDYMGGAENLPPDSKTVLGVPPVAWQFLAGTTLFVSVFMVTDPVSAPKKKQAQIAYGFLIGFLVVFLRWRGIFVAAATFSVLLGNLTGPLLDLAAGAWDERRKARQAAGQPAPATPAPQEGGR